MTLIGFWWACHQPERPPDPYVMWHYRDCPACKVKIAAVAMQHGDDPHVLHLNDLMQANP